MAKTKLSEYLAPDSVVRIREVKAPEDHSLMHGPKVQKNCTLAKSVL